MTKLNNEQVAAWQLAMEIHDVMVQAGFVKLAMYGRRVSYYSI